MRIHDCALLLLLAILANGCHGSRWAKRDADYRHKYSKHTNNVAKTIKQAVDARHVRGKQGFYIAGAGRDDPVAAGAEAGIFGYAEPWCEYRAGLSGLLHETGDHPLSGGMIGSARLQVPSRLAPFVGLGVYGGWAGLESAEDDGIDNDDDSFVDEPGENDSAFALAVFPEVGAHFWLNHRTRITTSVTYYVTNQGRDDDFLFYSVGLSFFGRAYERERHCPPVSPPDPDFEDFLATPTDSPPAGTNVLTYAGIGVGPLPEPHAAPSKPVTPNKTVVESGSEMDAGQEILEIDFMGMLGVEPFANINQAMAETSGVESTTE